MFQKFFAGVLAKLEKMSTPTKLGLIALMSFVALWLVCKKVSGRAFVPSVESVESVGGGNPTRYIPGAGMQDPGYGSGAGSVGLEPFTAECLGLDAPGTRYPSMPFYQMACKPEPRWNLPLDARIRHQPVYGPPEGPVHPVCQHRHPMDSIYAPPNEGISL